MGEKISLGEDMLRIDIIDQSSDLDGQVEKRLNDMVAIPHVPKINGVIPSFDEETSDHQRLLDRLQLYGLVENKVQGDGNYQTSKIMKMEKHHFCLSSSDSKIMKMGKHHFRKNVIGRLKAMGGLKVTNLAFGGNKMFVTRKDQQAV
ncbi:hypothetical protein GOBAR_DD19340 [Gossypium barbadense]|nr:hypothetical protein GOBAR_DD19340 [Gossypium barbadense]